MRTRVDRTPVNFGLPIATKVWGDTDVWPSTVHVFSTSKMPLDGHLDIYETVRPACSFAMVVQGAVTQTSWVRSRLVKWWPDPWEFDYFLTPTRPVTLKKASRPDPPVGSRGPVKSSVLFCSKKDHSYRGVFFFQTFNIFFVFKGDFLLTSRGFWRRTETNQSLVNTCLSVRVGLYGIIKPSGPPGSW